MPSDLTFPEPLVAFWRERHLCTVTTLRGDGSPHVVPMGIVLDPEAGRRLGRSPPAPRRRSPTCAAAPTRGSRSARSTAAAGRRSRARPRCARTRTSVAEAVRRYAERYRQPRENPARVALRIQHHPPHRQRLRGTTREAALPARHPARRRPGQRRSRATATGSPCSTPAWCGWSTTSPATFEDRASQTVREPGVRADRLHGHRDRGPAGDPHRPAAPDLRQGPVHHARAVGAGQGRLPLQRLACGATGWSTPNLGGTARTLDDIDGAIPLENGVLAFNGVALVDDSTTVLLDDDGWIAPRRPGTLDLYVFAYGRDYKARPASALYALTGPTPLLPRYALGNWWSRYHPYTADEYVDLMDRFRAEDVPLSVAGHRHGLAPGRHRPQVRQRLDRLHLEHRPVPGPAGIPRRPARARAGDLAQRAPGRGRARARGGVRRDREADGHRPGLRAAGELRPDRPGLHRGLLRGAAPPARGRGRRLLVAGLAAGRRHQDRRASTRCGCSTTSTTSTPAGTGSGR